MKLFQKFVNPESAPKSLQRVGRAIRLFKGKDHAIIIETQDNAHYLSKHTAERKRIYKTEKAFEIIG